MTVQLRIRVEREQKKEVKEKWPGMGEAPIWPTVLTFEASERVKSVPKKQMKDIFETALEKHKDAVRQEVNLNDKEVISVVQDDKGGGEIWRGTVSIPQGLQDDST